ncbi:MAG: hypothetical protein HYY78_18370 [Betaproteobacteria bacterium]|nr:hypothetical protein [Betaproteobacteria bacterium]
MSEESLTDQIIRRLKNHKLVAIFIVVGTVIGGLALFATSIDKIISVFERRLLIGTASSPSSVPDSSSTTQAPIAKDLNESKPKFPAEKSSAMELGVKAPGNQQESETQQDGKDAVPNGASLQSAKYEDSRFRGVASISAMIVNTTNSNVSLKAIIISGQKRAKINCRLIEKPNRWQIVNLDWKGVSLMYIQNKPTNFLLYEGGNVQIRIKRASCADFTHEVQIYIPMPSNIKPKHQINFVLDLREALGIEELDSTIPKNLRDWEDLTLAAEAVGHIEPAKIKVIGQAGSSSEYSGEDLETPPNAISPTLAELHKTAKKLRSLSNRDLELNRLVDYAVTKGDVPYAVTIAKDISSSSSRDLALGRIVEKGIELKRFDIATRAAESISSSSSRDLNLSRVLKARREYDERPNPGVHDKGDAPLF